MALAIRTGPDGQDEFYDDGTGNDASTGAAYTPGSAQESGSNAGEWNAKQYMDAASAFLPEDSSLHQVLGTEPSASDYRKQYDLMGSKAADTPKDDNVFSRIGGKMGKGLSDAYDKDPLAFLKMGVGSLAEAYKAKLAREIADRQAQSAVEVVNARAAADKAAQDRYNSSFDTTTKRSPVAGKPLTRLTGGAVFDTNGRLKG